jgi:hypothetical protein
MSQVATVEFHRPRAKWRDRVRSYKLIVDEREVGKIRAGQTVRIEVSPGTHTVQARISWTGSQKIEFAVENGTHGRVRVEPAGDTFHALEQSITREGYLRLTVE